MNTEHSRVVNIVRFLVAAALLAVTLAALAPLPVAHAATFVVDTTTDSNDAAYQQCTAAANDCSLRGAISKANALAGADAITLPAGTYTLTISGASEDSNASGDLDVTSEITINGAEASSTIIQAGTTDSNGIDRVFHVVNSSGDLTLDGVTLRYGNPSSGRGGGVYNSGTLTIEDSAMSGNSADRGGGISNNYGTVTIRNSTISDNSAFVGGGVYNDNGTVTVENSTISGNSYYQGGGVDNDNGTMTIRNSTISNNSVDADGGGVCNHNQATLTIKSSTISNNSAYGDGGGVCNDDQGTATIENSTISGNTAGTYGGGVRNLSTSAAVTLIHSTITDNTADVNNDDAASRGGGLAWRSGSGAGFIVKNTIIAGNTDAGNSSSNNCWGDSAYYTSQGYNLVGAGTGCPSGGTGDQTTSDPRLDPLQDNGGSTQTHALQYNSPAVEQIPNGTNGCGTDYTSDQRGESRPQGGLCDVGAYESPYIIWDGGGADDNTSTAGNWRGDILPGPANIPVFYNNGDVTVDADLTVAGWIVDNATTGGITLWPNPRLTVNGDWLHLDGYFTADYYGRIDVAGAFHISGGQFVVSPNYCSDCNGWLKVGGGIYHTGGNLDADSGSIILDTGNQSLMTTTTLGDLYINDGLLGYWKLDEGTGSSTADSSGYHNYGTLSGDPAWSADTPGTDFGNPYALDFDGAGDYVAIDGVAAEVGGAVSIALWVNAPSDSGGIQSLLAVNTASQGNVIVLGIRGADEYQVLDGGSGAWEGDTNTDVADGTWHHLAYTSDGVTGRLYVDGAEQATHTPDYSFASDDLWSLGQEWDTGGPSDFLNGLLDDVRVYNRALSGTDIQALSEGGHPQTSVATISLGSALNIEGDLVLNSGTLDVSPVQAGYWKLDEGSGTSAADASGNSNDGTLAGAPAWTTDVPGTHFANTNALNLDGVDDYVAMNGLADDVSGETSISLWVKAASGATGDHQALVAANTATGGNVVVLFIRDNDEYQLYDGTSDAWEGDTNTDVADGTWHHLAYTTDGTTGRLYVDGVEKATHTPDYAFSGDDLWSIGQEWDGGSPSNFLAGTVDDVRVYNGVLSAAEVQALAEGYSVQAHDITVAGDLVRNGGVFEHGGGHVTFDGSGTQNLDTDTIAFYDLTVNSGATLDLKDKTIPTVDGALTNSGTLQQQRNVQDGTTQFLRILNQAGDATRYYGLDIYMPASSTDEYLGWTTVTLRGNQLCPNASSGVQRCFELDPATSQVATVTFYYTEAERGGLDNAAMNVYHWNGSSWVEEPGTHSRGGSGDGQWWVQVTGVDEYSPFALGNNNPTAVTLASFTATAVDDGVLLEWETASEIDLLGFHLYRAEAPDGPQTCLTADLIPGQAPGSPTGAAYQFRDEAVEPGVTYWYWLEGVDVHGRATRHGPVTAQALPGSQYRIYLPLMSR